MSKVKTSDIELVRKAEKKVGDDVITNSEVQNVSEPVSFGKKAMEVITFFTVEPFLLCYLLPSIISAVTVQKLNMEKACRADLGHPESFCADLILGIVDDNDTLAVDALTNSQILVADMTAWTQPIQSGIPAIFILFVGAWSDKTGNRKTLMLLPVIGELVSSIGLILTTYFFHWPLWVTGLIECLPTALSGGLSIALMGSYSFIADITATDSRTFRIGVVAIIVTLGFPIGTAISGVLTEGIGYYGIFGINVAFYGFALIYVFLRIKDVKSEPLQGTVFEKLIEFFHPKNAWETFSLLFLSRKKELIKILLVLGAHIVIMGPIFGEGAVLYLYLTKKYHMDLIDFSYFSTYVILVGLAGTSVAVTVFSKLLKMHDAALGIITTTSKIAGSFMYAFAPTRIWLYTAPVLDFFGTTCATAIRSLGTKVVSADKVGKMCSLIGFVEAIVPVIYTPLYSKVYSKTLDSFAGAFYFIGGLMTIPGLFIFIALYVILRKQERDTVKDPAAKETYAHDNAITVL